MKLKEYSPAEFNLHTVRITFMSGVYIGHIAYRYRGSCRGGEMLDADYIETIDEDDVRKFVENDCQFTFDEEDLKLFDDILPESQSNFVDVNEYILKDSNGYILAVKNFN